MSPLTIASRDAATGPVLELTGDLDYATAPELRKALDSLTLTSGQLLVLDLAGLDYCDSSGITTLLAARNLTIQQNSHLALTASPTTPPASCTSSAWTRSSPSTPTPQPPPTPAPQHPDEHEPTPIQQKHRFRTQARLFRTGRTESDGPDTGWRATSRTRPIRAAPLVQWRRTPCGRRAWFRADGFGCKPGVVAAGPGRSRARTLAGAASG